MVRLRMTAFVIAFSISIAVLVGCGNSASIDSTSLSGTITAVNISTSVQSNVDETESTSSGKITEEISAQETSRETEIVSSTQSEKEPFSTVAMEYEFSSGAGAWYTTVKLNSDGTFTGNYNDWDMGGATEENPRGEVWMCNFSGKFSEPVKVDDYTWNMKLEDLKQEGNKGDSYIQDEMKYIYTVPYGIDGGENFEILFPGKDITGMDALKSWLNSKDKSNTLTRYCLHNVDTGAYFFGYEDYSNSDTYFKATLPDGMYYAALSPADADLNSFIDDVSISEDALVVSGILNYNYEDEFSSTPDRVTPEGTYSFPLSADTRLCISKGVDKNNNDIIKDMNREEFLNACKLMNGLGLIIYVDDGVVQQAMIPS